MEFLGVGPLELLFIILIVILLFGPKDIEKGAKTVGRGIYKLLQSDSWKTISQTSRQIQNLPRDLIRQAGVEELQKDLQKDINAPQGSVEYKDGLPGQQDGGQAAEAGNVIRPPDPATPPDSEGQADAAGPEAPPADRT